MLNSYSADEGEDNQFFTLKASVVAAYKVSSTSAVPRCVTSQ